MPPARIRAPQAASLRSDPLGAPEELKPSADSRSPGGHQAYARIHRITRAALAVPILNQGGNKGWLCVTRREVQQNFDDVIRILSSVLCNAHRVNFGARGYAQIGRAVDTPVDIRDH